MLFRQLITFLPISLLMIGCCQQKPPVDTKADMEKIQALSNQWTAAIIAKDVDKIITTYAPDAVQLQGGFQAISGRDEIRKWYLTWVNDSSLAYTALTVTIEVASSLDLAYERGTYSFNIHTPKGLEKEIGKYVTIWKKINGEWKAIIDTGTPDNTL